MSKIYFYLCIALLIIMCFFTYALSDALVLTTADSEVSVADKIYLDNSSCDSVPFEKHAEGQHVVEDRDISQIKLDEYWNLWPGRGESYTSWSYELDKYIESIYDENAFYPIRVCDPQIVKPLSECGDNGWIIAETNSKKFIKLSGISREPRDTFYWLDDNRVLYFDPLGLYCIDLNKNEVKTLMLLNNIFITDLSIYNDNVEKFAVDYYNPKDMGGARYGDAIYFDKANKEFSVMTCTGTFDIDPYALYTFSEDDLSFIERKDMRDVEFSIDKTVSEIWFDSLYGAINGYISNEISGPLDFEASGRQIWLKNIFDSNGALKRLNLMPQYNYSYLRFSPSGDYIDLYNFTKSDNDREYDIYETRPDIPAYIEIFDMNGNQVGEFAYNDYFSWQSSHRAGIGGELWHGCDRVYVDGKYYYANGIPVAGSVGFFVQKDETEEFFDLLYRKENGDQILIKEKISRSMKFDKLEDVLVFNPSFTACVFRCTGKEEYCDIGICRWELPKELA